MRNPSGRSSLVLVLLATMLLAAMAPANQPEPVVTQARVEFDSMEEWHAFRSIEGLDIMRSKPGVGVTLVTDLAQIEELRDLGYDVTVEIADMKAHYRTYAPREDFGDYYTNSEMLDFLDALHATYPSITTARDSVGTSCEGRALWVMKISDNPDVNETEPEVFFDGLHHAREVVTPMAIAHYMTWLCENYGTDAEATFLVDNREIWFMPIVNPDGFIYNEMNGWGSMWRKNRRDNAGSSCYGVDPNRNYDYMWGYSGTSSDPCSDVYKGLTPHSEPEIQGYTNFVAAHEFITNITFHSVAGMILLPWGYDYNYHTADDALFREMCNDMAQYNGYQVGQAGEILYDCAGTTCDWFYGVEGGLSVCVEVSGSGFWPSDSELPGLVAENLWPQQYMTRVAGSYLAMRDNYTLAGGNGDQNPDPGETLDLRVTIDNESVGVAATNATVTLTTDDPYVQLNDAFTSLGTIAARDYATNFSDPFSFTLDPSTPDGHGLVFTVEIAADGFYMETDIVWMVGSPTLLFADDMESGGGNWVENDGYWGTTSSSYHSFNTSYTDSPSGNYGDYRNTWIELADPIDLSSAAAAELRFWHKVDTEENYDFCYVEASDDGGMSWLQVGEKFHGNWPWAQIVFPLDDFVGT
ncbi:hypothetical protein KAW64_02570, partial [bacterium]|nr:hypothetical protein [bacterium]